MVGESKHLQIRSQMNPLEECVISFTFVRMHSHYTKAYFTEFEFCFRENEQVIYWFPVLINSKSVEGAEAVKNKLISLLTRNFNLLKTYELREYTNPLYSKTLKPLVEHHSKVEVLKLNLKELQIATFREKIGIQLANHITIVPQTLLMEYNHTINHKLENQNFLTTQFYDDLDFEKEFLVVKFNPLPNQYQVE